VAQTRTPTVLFGNIFLKPNTSRTSPKRRSTWLWNASITGQENHWDLKLPIRYFSVTTKLHLQLESKSANTALGCFISLFSGKQHAGQHAIPVAAHTTNATILLFCQLWVFSVYPKLASCVDWFGFADHGRHGLVQLALEPFGACNQTSQVDTGFHPHAVEPYAPGLRWRCCPGHWVKTDSRRTFLAQSPMNFCNSLMAASNPTRSLNS
jgi:hypothetical protein